LWVPHRNIDDISLDFLRFPPFHLKPANPTQQTHIGHLPSEVLNYILKVGFYYLLFFQIKDINNCLVTILPSLQWVVSSELDVRSLESCSQVSRGFYVAARDEEIWR
jgi:hypothetical protein